MASITPVREASSLSASSSPTTKRLQQRMSIRGFIDGKSKSTRRGTYSIAKFVALQKYNATTSPWRVAWVMATTPLYGLVGALLPAFVPLQDPLLGIRANPGYMQLAFLISVLVFVGTITQARAGTGLPESVYSRRQVVAVGLIAALVETGAGLVAAFAWRFPVPMSWVVISVTAGSNLMLGHLIVFRSRCWTDRELQQGIRRYVPALLFQCAQIAIYPAFSVLFDRVSSLYQVLLTLLFPVIKFVMKRGLKYYSRDLKDFSTEVGVSGIEICASLYQSMIMQNAPSKAAMAIIIGVDVLQGLITVKIFMDKKSDIPQKNLVREALKEIESQRSVGTTECKQPNVDSTDSTSATYDSTCLPLALPFAREEQAVISRAVKPTAVAPTPPPASARKSHTTSLVQDTSRQPSPTVRQALELVNAAESILLVEYLEVAIPLVNALFVAISCQFSSAQYNMKLRNLYFHPDALSRSVLSIALYSLLQALSFVAMHLVMKHRYGLSATYHLAFILEHHWESIVGKMLGWLPIILYFNVIHFGVDFSFRFDFAAMLNDGNS